MLFHELFRIMGIFDPKNHKEHLKEVFKFWELIKLFVDDKNCFAEIIQYEFVELLKTYVLFLSTENFLDNPNLHIPLDASNSNESTFSSSFKASRISSGLCEKISQKLNLITLVLHALDAILQLTIEKKKQANEQKIENAEKIIIPLIEKPNKMETKENILNTEIESKISDKQVLTPSKESILKEKIPFPEDKTFHDSVIEHSINENLNSSTIKVVYTSKEKKGFSDYINPPNLPQPLPNSLIINISFDSLYEIIEILIKRLVPLHSKEVISCYCSTAEVVLYMSKILSVIREVDFEPITMVLQSLSNGCLYKSLENHLIEYPVFDHIIESCFLIHERFKFSVEKQIGAICETLLKEKGFFKEMLKDHIYLYFLNTVSKLNFKKIGWDLKNTVADLLYIMVMNFGRFDSAIYSYYLLIITKQIVLHYDIKNFPGSLNA